MGRENEFIEPLEPRRLRAETFAYDLTVTGVDDLAPYAKPGGKLHCYAIYDNVGNANFEGTSQISFTLSADQTLGNADDLVGSIYEFTRVRGKEASQSWQDFVL